jgi:cell division protease FtsH
MSERLGPIQYGERDEMIFLGRSLGESRNYSDKVAQQIDEEVRGLVDEAYQLTHRILEEHRDKLDAVSLRLLEVETLHRPEFEAIMRGEQIVEQPVSTPSAKSRTERSQTGVSDEERKREGEGRDKGLDLGGTLPAPA